MRCNPCGIKFPCHSRCRKHNQFRLIFEPINENDVKLILKHLDLHFSPPTKEDYEEIKHLLNKYLKPMLNFNIDHLVLGCTHYPYLIPQIREIIGNKVVIIDSGAAVAKQTKAILEKNNLSANNPFESSHHFYTNGNRDVLETILNDVPSKFTIEKLNY